MPRLTIAKAGPAITVQDLGRPGWTAQGLSTGGAADPLALLEAAALLGTDGSAAALEMFGLGGDFRVSEPMRIALTGAKMAARIDEQPISPDRTYLLLPGQTLHVGSARQGVYGYLSFAGGITTTPVLNSRSAHLTAGIGGPLKEGQTVPLGPDPAPDTAACHLPRDDRFGGGMVRLMPGPQTGLFTEDVRTRFFATQFLRSRHGNRQGVRLDYDGPRFAASGQLNLVSDLIMPGDVQLTGDGTPFVLLAECQTIGGYPRIGTVVPADLPKVAQAGPGVPLDLRLVSVAEADATAVGTAKQLEGLRAACRPLVRNPHDIPDLLGYQLISGVTAGGDDEGRQDD